VDRSAVETTVLLPASVLRRADAVRVIGAALLAKAGGWGHRRVAAWVDRPASTVWGWLRRIGQVAERVLAALGVVAAEFGTEFVAPAPASCAVAAVVEIVAATRAAGRRLGGSCSPWRLAAVLCGGRLLAPRGPDLAAGVGTAGDTSWLGAGDG